MDLSNLVLYTPPKIHPNWFINDYLGALKVRLSVGRNDYRVKPGLYKLGNPDKKSEVIVTANYKLSFDIVRKSLKGENIWLLILETYGINVWCAAGKGTFGTNELIHQIKESQLNLFIDHKRIIVPQLGAPGVSAYKVKEATGFKIKFGPIRAEDIKGYISSNYKKSENERTVRFNMLDRLILTPVEIVNSLKYYLIAVIFMLLISGISKNGFSLSNIMGEGPIEVLFLTLSYISGAFLTPLFLPWIPFRKFSGKGLLIGLISFGIVSILLIKGITFFYIGGWILVSGSVSSFLAMNFTGASTYTSLSGVKKEMKLFVPIQIIMAIVGLLLIITSKLI